MSTFLRYLVYCFIVLYIIGWICIALSLMLEHILESQGTSEGVVHRESYTLYYVTDCLRMHEMYNEIMRTMQNAFHRIPDLFKTQEMCNEAVEVDPWQLKDIPDQYKMQEMCDKAARDYLFSLRLVPDWFVTQQQLDVLYIYNDNEMIRWYDGYKARKAQKLKIKDELFPTACHPDRIVDWCMSEDKKKQWK